MYSLIPSTLERTNTDMGKGGRAVSVGAKSVAWAVTLADDGPT
jgi:hypothetical protein